jgi:predicted Zn-dependent peptidase
LGWLSISSPRAATRDSGRPGQAAQKKVLKNGLTLISETDDSSATTVIQILIKGGQRAEPADKAGLAFLATRLAVEVPDEDKVQELISMASRFQVAVKGDFSVIQVECLSGQLEATLKILARIIGDPLFSSFRIDAVKKHAEHQGKIEEDDSSVFGHLAALRAFSGSPGYGGSVFGDKKTLGAVRGRDISDFYKRFFVAPNLIIAVSSDRADAPALVEGSFRDFPGSPPPAVGAAESRVPEEKEIRLTRATRQSFVSLAFPLPKLSRRGFALGLLLENILGKGPGSRLWPLRAEKKLAYTVNAVATQFMDGGLLEAYLETDKDKQPDALEALRGVLADLYQGGVSDDDLRVARTSVWADYLRDNETKPPRTLNLAAFEAMGLGLEFFYELRSELDKVTLAELNAHLRSILAPEKGLAVIIGPRSEARPGQSLS